MENKNSNLTNDWLQEAVKKTKMGAGATQVSEAGSSKIMVNDYYNDKKWSKVIDLLLGFVSPILYVGFIWTISMQAINSLIPFAWIVLSLIGLIFITSKRHYVGVGILSLLSLYFLIPLVMFGSCLFN